MRDIHRELRSTYRTLAVVLVVLAESAHAETFEGAVVRVVDGDSLVVLRGKEQVRVRLKKSTPRSTPSHSASAPASR
jgi:endonuclease YncB( thermonuclease family)